MRTSVILVSVLLIPLTACGGSDETTVEGTVTVTGATEKLGASPGDECTSSGGYAAVNKGERIVIGDSDGKQVATGKLRPGQTTNDKVACRFGFTVDDVPSDDSYTLTIGSLPRFSFSERQAGNLRLQLPAPGASTP